MPSLRVVLFAGVFLFASITVTRGTEPQASVPELMARIEGPQSPNRQGFDPLTIQQMMKKLHVPGASVAVIKNFSVQWAKGYGVADLKTGEPVSAETMFQAASISKPVTAMAFLKMVQEGKATLDDDANRYLKSWKIPTNEFTRESPVTPRSLLSHTSGTGDGFGFPGYEPEQARPTLVQILNGEKPSNVGPVFWERRPFTAFKYSGGAVTVIQLLMTDVLEKPFDVIMAEYVLRPLGMTSSTYQQPIPPELDRKAARGHSGGQLSNVKWHVYPEQAAAGLWTTPTDLARFAIAVQKANRGDDGSILPRVLAREMLSPVGIGDFAVGLGVEKRGQGWYFTHSGGNWGFSCDLVAHFVKGYGVVVMTNSDAGGTLVREIEARVAAADDWDSLDKPVPR